MLLAIDRGTGDWRLPHNDSEPLWRIRIEKAKSGRAKCKNCGEFVKTGEWRVGTPIKWRTYISAWSHPKCFFVKDGDPPIDSNFAQQVFGWELLSLGGSSAEEEDDPDDEVAMMKRELSKSGVPEHLGGVITQDALESGDFLRQSSSSAAPAPPPARLPAPDQMTLALLPFQEEGHAWMLQQERGALRGGILADEMGLGKTIQTVALLVSSKHLVGGGGAGPTLIVAPASAVLQWQDEIARSTAPGTLKVLVYNTLRTTRMFTPRDLLQYDVVLTSYPVLEQEYRQAINAQKVECEYCNRKFLKRKLASHLKYFCGPDAVKTARLEKQEKKREEGTKKAMQTLRIGTSSAAAVVTTTTTTTPQRRSAITPTAIYRELMADAGRTPSSMMATAAAARAADVAAGSVVELSEEEEETAAVVVVEDESSDEDEVQAVDVPESARSSAPSSSFSPTSKLWYSGQALFWELSPPGTWRAAGGSKPLEPWTRVEGGGGGVVELHRNRERVRLFSDAMERSTDAGKTWKRTQPQQQRGSFWVGTREEEEGGGVLLTTGDEHVGEVVARRFGRKDVLGVVVGVRPEDEEGDALYRVQHCDGDREDLDVDEVPAARLRIRDKLSLGWLLEKPVKEAAPPPAPPQKKQKKTKAAAAATTPAKEKKQKKKAPPRASRTRRRSKDEADTDSEFEDDCLAAEADKPRRRGSQASDDDDEPFSAGSSSSDDDEDEDEAGEEEEEEEEEEEDEAEPSRPLPRFVPQTWGVDDAYEGFTAAVESKNRIKRKKQEEQQRKRKRAAAAAAASSKKKKKKTKRSSSSSSNGAGGGDDDDDFEDDDEYEVEDDEEDGEDEEEEDVPVTVMQQGKVKPTYAPAGDIMDEDGLDLNRSLLHCIAWKRVIIDEAHKIKERTNSTAKSVFALRGKLQPRIQAAQEKKVKKTDDDDDDDDEAAPQTAFDSFCQARLAAAAAAAGTPEEDGAKKPAIPKKQLLAEWKQLDQRSKDQYLDSSSSEHGASVLLDECHRWALTGTPLMNRLGDLYSLVRFLRAPPYTYYYCKKDQCECRLLQWSFGWDAKYCQHCGHTPMSHYSYFNKTIMNPVSRNGYMGEGRRAMELLRDDLLGQVMLRRTKAEREQDLNLPPLTTSTVDIVLSESQRDFYESIYKLSKAKFNTFVAKGTVLNNYAHVFQLLSRLRQASDHPYLILGQDAVNATTADVCAICLMNVDDPFNLAVAKCRHTFHRECVEQYMDNFDPEKASAAAAASAGPGAKKKKAAAAAKPKKKKGGGDQGEEEEEEGGKAAPLVTCPSCFVPLTLTLRVHQDDVAAASSSSSVVEAVAATGEEEEPKPSSSSSSSSSDHSTCVICMDRPRNALLLPCGHVHMCHECAAALDNKTCPVCRVKIEKVVKSTSASSSESAAASSSSSKLFGRKSILQGLKLEEFQSSSKLDAIVEQIGRVVGSEDQLEKIIVFSQFTTFLDLIQWRLQTLHITGVVKFVGSLNAQERRGVLHEFKTNPQVRVILMSLKAGAEGLNLQEASVVLSVDPWWNPSVEMQAFHRAHRIGQTRPVRAIRFVTKDTIEERMMQLQDKKRLIFEACVDGNDASLAKLTQEDLQFLFSN